MKVISRLLFLVLLGSVILYKFVYAAEGDSSTSYDDEEPDLEKGIDTRSIKNPSSPTYGNTVLAMMQSLHPERSKVTKENIEDIESPIIGTSFSPKTVDSDSTFDSESSPSRGVESNKDFQYKWTSYPHRTYHGVSSERKMSTPDESPSPKKVIRSIQPLSPQEGSKKRDSVIYSPQSPLYGSADDGTLCKNEKDKEKKKSQFPDAWMPWYSEISAPARTYTSRTIRKAQLPKSNQKKGTARHGKKLNSISNPSPAVEEEEPYSSLGTLPVTIEFDGDLSSSDEDNGYANLVMFRFVGSATDGTVAEEHS